MRESAACREVGITDQASAEQASAEQTSMEHPIAVRAVPERVSTARALALAESILALGEPWRARFVELVARYVGVDADGETITLETLAGWLVDADLHERIGLMLRSWTGSR